MCVVGGGIGKGVVGEGGREPFELRAKEIACSAPEVISSAKVDKQYVVDVVGKLQRRHEIAQCITESTLKALASISKKNR